MGGIQASPKLEEDSCSKIEKEAVKWIRSFLGGRFTSIRTNEAVNESSEISTGIPQGSPLSSILYLFYNADLLDIEGR